jgi:hypothetical protein
MKQVKMLGLAGVVALGLTAMAGASTASATELCSTNTSPCTGTVYTSGTAVSAQLKAGTVATLTNDISNVICQKSTAAGKTTSTSGNAVTGTITSLGFTDCKTASGVPCATVDTLNIPYAASITATVSGNGTLTVTKDLSGDPGVTVECASLINCTFSTASASLGVTGGNPAIAKANGIALTKKGITCPIATPHWDAEYEVTAPKPLFIVNP